MNYRIAVQITTPLNPTEVRERVETAIYNLFPDVEIEEYPGELLAETHSIDRFAEHLTRQNIVPTARDVFYSNREGVVISFDLKKTAAFEGVVNFAVGNPDELGDIHVRIRVDEPTVDAFIDYLAPSETHSETS